MVGNKVRGYPAARPPLERMLFIHKKIESGSYPNATRLSNELEVSTKSIQRDIEFMRDRMNLPLEYDSQKFGYYYSEEVGGFPTLQITEGEFFAMVIAEKALQQYRGTSFEKPLVSAFNKMAASLPETISVNLQEWDETISFRTSAEPILDLEIFDQLARATAGHEQLILHYRKPGNNRIEPRKIDPYHLANINGEWFLFAWCHLRNALRTFVPMRIKKVEKTGQTFQRPKDFSLQDNLRNSFGVLSGNHHYDVVIQFSGLVEDYIREKKWHPSQKLKTLPEGGVELQMQLSGLAEVQRWILGWGGEARVICPDALREAVHQAARGIMENNKTAEKNDEPGK